MIKSEMAASAKTSAFEIVEKSRGETPIGRGCKLNHIEPPTIAVRSWMNLLKTSIIYSL